MKIAVCIAAHERMVPLAIVLKHLPTHWHAVVVLSDHENGEHLKQRPNTHVFNHANQPLGQKWQYAVDRARELAPDLVIIEGSDDVFLVKEAQLLQVMATHDYAGPRSFLAYDGSAHWRMTYKEHVPMPIGSGRVYRRDLLERMRWRLFDTTREKLLDDLGHRNAMRHGANLLCVDRLPGLEVVAMKGPWPCKNPLDKYLRGKNLNITEVPHVRHRISYQF